MRDREVDRGADASAVCCVRRDMSDRTRRESRTRRVGRAEPGAGADLCEQSLERQDVLARRLVRRDVLDPLLDEHARRHTADEIGDEASTHRR